LRLSVRLSESVSFDYPGRHLFEKLLVARVGQAGGQQREFVKGGTRESLRDPPRVFDAFVLFHQLAYPGDFRAGPSISETITDAIA
jgi:hypothetical protein